MNTAILAHIGTNHNVVILWIFRVVDIGVAVYGIRDCKNCHPNLK